MPPVDSQFITDSIELVAPIAEGAMGNVWEAYHHRLQTRVAVKFVSENLGENTPEALARFQREAAAASQIKSVHVVRTFDSGVSLQGAPYMVMELLEGWTLGARIREGQALSLQEVAVLLSQVGRAIDMAHQHGIIHRDIKPDNIFLCPADEESSTQPFFFCKILDFGIAKQTQLPKMGGLTTEGKIVGTPEFMSPEQVLEEGEVDRRADLWALGVVCYVGLTLCLPFQGKTLGQLCLELANPKPEKVSLLRPELSPQVDAWFARCFHRDSKHRFASAKEMSKSFAALLSGSEPATLYPSTPLAIQGAMKTRRAKRSVALAAGAAAVGGLLLALAWPGPSGDANSPAAATSEPPSGETSTTPSVTGTPVTTSSAPAKASPTASGSVDSPVTPPKSATARSRPAKPPARLPRRSPPPAKTPNRNKSDRRGEEQLGF